MTSLSGTPAVAAADGPRWHAHRFNRAPVYRAAVALTAVLPRRARLGVACALADALAGRFAAERAVIERTVRRVLPAATAAERARVVTDVFRHFAMCFADLVAANRGRRAARLLAGVEGEAHVRAAASGGRGVVVVTAHVGNWELGGRLLARRLARPTHVVVAAEPDPRVERFLRGGPGPVRFVRRGAPTAALSLVPALRRGEVVALQGDRALGTRGDATVPFFGADAAFPLGPFVLARAAGVAVLPAFCLLGADRRYTVRVGAPLEVPAGGEADAQTRWVGALEAVVARHPEQWFNFFDVWSAVPGR